jgi:hypothetical protein
MNWNFVGKGAKHTQMQIQSNLSIATTQDHGRAWSLWTGGLYIQVNYIGKTQGGRREQVVASTGNRYIQVVAKAGLAVIIITKHT